MKGELRGRRAGLRFALKGGVREGMRAAMCWQSARGGLIVMWESKLWHRRVAKTVGNAKRGVKSVEKETIVQKGSIAGLCRKVVKHTTTANVN